MNPTPLTKQRILWCDDEIDMLRPYIIYLEQKGYEVLTANNAMDAIDICEREHLDIVFMDENMPGMSGIEAVSDIRQAQPTLPIVMVTKSEEENLMEEAIGEQIADFLIKPVNPSQILLTLKKHLNKRAIIEEKTNTTYQQEFQEITHLINTATTWQEWMMVEKLLTQWDLKLGSIQSPMQEMLQMQRTEAEKTFAKFVAKNYKELLGNEMVLNSTNVLRKKVFPLLDEQKKVCMVVIDNFRYDQWKTIQPLLSESFKTIDESMYCAILPTATQYARNAIFAGLTPLQITEMYPQYWVEEGDEEGKNLHEQELIETQLQRFRRKNTFAYYKVNEGDYCNYVMRMMRMNKVDLQVIVLNFIDMLSHSRTESKMMRELANDEAAYRSLTESWFKHSQIAELFRFIAQQGYTLVLTTDHGTIRVDNPVSIIGDRETNTNLRYKVGKSLTCKSKDVFVMEKPKEYGLPIPQLSSSYVYATDQDFFGYPNNFNYYAQYYRNTFQHGGISLEEMLIPVVVME